MHKGIAAAISAVAVFAFTGGIVFPLLSFVMERHGASPTFIGISGAMMPAGILVGAPLIPLLARRFGAFRVCMAGFGATALLILALAATGDFRLWLPLRFVLGFAVNAIFVVSETWINTLAPSRGRGRVVGIYVTVASVGFASGPVLLGLVGSEGLAPFLVAALAPLLALPILVRARHCLPDVFDDRAGGSVVAFARTAPVLVAVVAMVSLYDQTVLAMFPVYGLAAGLGETATSLSLSAAIVGNVALQVPLGWLAERLDRRRVLLGLALAAATGLAALPSVLGTIWGWPVLFVVGACAFGGFTVCLVELGERFSGSMLLAGNAAFAMVWGLGGLAGPPLAGAAMERFGPDGFPATLCLLFLALALVLAAFPLVGRNRAAAA